MKKINIIYWIATGLLLALMLWSAIGSLTNNPQGVQIMTQLGYPAYLGHFLGVAKILGVIAILIPGFPRIKEWAYAGFAFDMIGATYSMYASGETASKWAMMLIFLALLACSYIFYHKKLK
jgi:uncharacterized membrane protein YphA (DoxX/SURF4 family)